MKTNKLKEHILYYLLQLVVVSTGIIGITRIAGRTAQSITLVIATIVYFLIAVIHHYLNHDLTLKIVVEYLLIGIFGISAFLLVLNSFL